MHVKQLARCPWRAIYLRVSTKPSVETSWLPPSHIFQCILVSISTRLQPWKAKTSLLKLDNDIWFVYNNILQVEFNKFSFYFICWCYFFRQSGSDLFVVFPVTENFVASRGIKKWPRMGNFSLAQLLSKTSLAAESVLCSRDQQLVMETGLRDRTGHPR